MAAPALKKILAPQIQDVLDALYADTIRTDPAVRGVAREQGVEDESHPGFYEAMRQAYMPVTPDFGALLYILARTARARCIVEFGTSFGISTIFLAAALRDNGGGRLITTEFEAAKAERARMNLRAAGLDEDVEIRVGDALLTLARDLPAQIDLVFLDGPKALYLDVLRRLEPHVASGAIIAGDNSDMAAAAAYLDYVAEPANGYVGSAILTSALGAHHGHQLAVKC